MIPQEVSSVLLLLVTENFPTHGYLNGQLLWCKIWLSTLLNIIMSFNKKNKIMSWLEVKSTKKLWRKIA